MSEQGQCAYPLSAPARSTSWKAADWVTTPFSMPLSSVIVYTACERLEPVFRNVEDLDLISKVWRSEIAALAVL